VAATELLYLPAREEMSDKVFIVVPARSALPVAETRRRGGLQSVLVTQVGPLHDGESSYADTFSAIGVDTAAPETHAPFVFVDKSFQRMSLWGLRTFDCNVGLVYPHLPMKLPEALALAEESDDPMAICNAGWCLFNGVGQPHDQKKAIELWKKSAERSGNAGACYNLAYCFMFGLVVKQDDQISSDWFAKYHRGRNAERLAFNVNRAALDT
jgi:TPR repeat protein